MGFSMDVGVPVVTVFLQGLLSFFSPCVLPLVPLYLGYLSGGAGQGELYGKPEHFCREQSHCKKRQDKSKCIHTDQKESCQLCSCTSRHQKHTRKSRSHARRPGKAKGKSEHKRHDR